MQHGAAPQMRAHALPAAPALTLGGAQLDQVAESISETTCRHAVNPPLTFTSKQGAESGALKSINRTNACMPPLRERADRRRSREWTAFSFAAATVLSGRLPISGAKNAALTLMPCALLTDEPLTLRNLPRLADVDSFGHLLNQLGASTQIEGARPEDFGRVMTIRAGKLTSTEAPYDIVRKMRASILVLGPLVGRGGEATVSLPGGCAIGNRPIDLHLKALEAIGAEIELAAGYVKATAPGGRLPGGRVTFPVVSVGATENALMAAVIAKGGTVHRKCRARARDRRSVQLPRRDGRVDRRHRHRNAGDRGPRPAARRDLPCDARSDRGGQLCLRGGDHRRIARSGRRRGERHARDARRADRSRGDGRRSARAAFISKPPTAFAR